MMIAKEATKTKSADCRIQEQENKIRELIDEDFKSRGQEIRFHLGQRKSIGDRFKELYGDWGTASYCIEIFSRNQVQR